MDTLTSDPRYPIGPFVLPSQPLTAVQRRPLIEQIATLPAQLTAVARRAGVERLEQSYRPGGWSGRQVIHHLADAHQYGYVRFRLTLTEDDLQTQDYDRNAWAQLPDVAATPVTVSLALLEALHSRWVNLLDHLTEEQWQRRYFHRVYERQFTLDETLAMYAWHCRHHLGHIELLAQDAA